MSEMDKKLTVKTAKAARKESLKKGFLRGFSAPFFFFSPIEIRRPSQFNGSVAKAWADVGRALNDAMVVEGAYIEQKAGRKTAGSKDPRKAA